MSTEHRTSYILELSPEQARVLCRACELLARLHIGQLDHLTWELIDVKNTSSLPHRREIERHLLSALRALYFPDLGPNMGVSLGVGNDEPSDIAWDLYQVVRYVQAWNEHPEGGYTVNFNEPLQTAKEPLATCTAVDVRKEEGENGG